MNRKSWVAVIVGAAIVGSAFGQTPLNVVPSSREMFEDVPVGGDYPRVFPRRAIERNQSGFAVLCCKANPDRSLSCALGAEWPARFGFGDASLSLVRKFRLTQAAYEQLRTQGSPILQTPFPWVLEPMPERQRTELAAAKSGMEGVCAARLQAPIT